MEEQRLYARWVEMLARLGLIALVVTFAVYVFGWLEPLVAPEALLRLWGLPADRYVAEIRGPTGWGWTSLLGKGDYLNYVGVVLLGVVSIAANARIVPTLMARGDRTYAVLAVLQVIVLVAAALY